jgi:hypothetical protein
MFRRSFALTPAVAGALKAARSCSAGGSSRAAADAATAAALFDGARS